MDRDDLIDELETLRKTEKQYRIMLDESMDPTFSFFADGTYRYVNNAFAKGVGKTFDEIIGRTIWDVFEKEEADKRFAVVKRVFAQGKIEEIEVRVPRPSGDTYYLTTVKPIFSDDGAVETVICTSKNITKRKLSEVALKEKHDKLLKAMEEIKTLSGLLPICASCKKIRDDKGYWNLLEAFIEKHSEASFSHGMCPECSEKLYGKEDWYIEMKKNEENK
jgi:PAS domain S-box-containing protein